MCFYKMEDILKEFGMNQFLSKFLEEGIDEESLFLIDDETLKILIPKAGPRLIFKNKLKRYVQGGNKENQMPEEVTNDNTQNDHGDEITDSSDTLTLTPSSSSSFEDSIADYIFPTDKEFYNGITLPQTIELNVDRQFCAPLVVSNLNQSSSSFSSPKRIKTSNIFPGGLENLLKKSVDGNIILANRNSLSNDHRQKLCKEIINHFLSVCDNCTSALLCQAAEEICKIFPNEHKDIYFIPYQPKQSDSPKLSAKGKLWSRYVNVRSALRIANSHSNSESTSKRTEEQSNQEDPEEENIFNTLKYIVEPKTKVLEYWQATNNCRRKFFTKTSITEIFEQIPSLKLQIGAELITSDFNVKYPEKADVIYLNFANVCQAITEESKKRRIRFADDLTDVNPQVLALLNLPYLFPPVTIRNGKKGNWRPSRTEVQESFILQVENFYEVKEIIEKREKKLKDYRLTLQPYIVVLGPLNNIEAYYVVINDVKYSFDSIIRALEVLFKAFHAFDIKYPYESQHLWIFLEESIFHMKISPRNAAASALIADLKPYLNI